MRNPLMVLAMGVARWCDWRLALSLPKHRHASMYPLTVSPIKGDGDGFMGLHLLWWYFHSENFLSRLSSLHLSTRKRLDLALESTSYHPYFTIGCIVSERVLVRIALGIHPHHLSLVRALTSSGSLGLSLPPTRRLSWG